MGMYASARISYGFVVEQDTTEEGIDLFVYELGKQPGFENLDTHGSGYDYEGPTIVTALSVYYGTESIGGLPEYTEADELRWKDQLNEVVSRSGITTDGSPRWIVSVSYG